MKISVLVNPKAVLTGIAAVNGEDCTNLLLAALSQSRKLNPEQAAKDLANRERRGTTLVPVGSYHVAMPHVSTSACEQLLMAVATCREGIPWKNTGKKANLVVMLLGPPQTQSLYLRMLSRLAHICQDPVVLRDLVEADSPQLFIDRLVVAESSLGDIAVSENQPAFCVLGAGHGGMAMAAHLSILGFNVNLFNRSEERIRPVQARGGIEVTGEIEGFAKLNVVTSNPSEALCDRDVLMLVVPATAHYGMAEIIAPYLKDGQILVLNPGRTGGALEVSKILRERNPSTKIYIAEAQTLLYAARVTNPGQVHIFSIKNSVPIASLPAYQTVDILPVIRKALPQFVPGDNVLKTSLDNIGAVFHPAITMLNTGRIEDTHGDFEYYVEGVTPAVANVLESLDSERVRVAEALGIRVNTAREWLYMAYDAAGKTLLDAMRANSSYAGIRSPRTMDHRYLSEDVPFSLVPIASIGDMLGIPTPVIKSFIQLASVMHGVDYWKQGRTVERLGLKGMSVKEIRFLVVGADVASMPAAPSSQKEQPSPGQETAAANTLQAGGAAL